jgi:hypothetical protein
MKLKDKKSFGSIFALVFLLTACGKSSENFLSRELTLAERRYLEGRMSARCNDENAVLVARMINQTNNAISNLEQDFLTRLNNDKTLVYELRQTTKVDSDATTTEISTYYLLDVTANDFVYVVMDKNNNPTKLSKESISTTNTRIHLARIMDDYCASNSSAASITEVNNVVTLKSYISTTSSSTDKNEQNRTYRVRLNLPAYFSKDFTQQVIKVTSGTDSTTETKTNSFDYKAAARYATPSELWDASCEFIKNQTSASINCSNFTSLADLADLVRGMKASEDGAESEE